MYRLHITCSYDAYSVRMCATIPLSLSLSRGQGGDLRPGGRPAQDGRARAAQGA